MAFGWPVHFRVTCLRGHAFSYIDNIENRKSYWCYMIYTVGETVFCAVLPFLSVGDWTIKSPDDLWCEFREILNLVLPLGKGLYSLQRILKLPPMPVTCNSSHKYIYFLSLTISSARRFISINVHTVEGAFLHVSCHGYFRTPFDFMSSSKMFPKHRQNQGWLFYPAKWTEHQHCARYMGWNDKQKVRLALWAL